MLGKSQTFQFYASIETTIEHNYLNEWLIVVTCYSRLSHMDGIPVQFIILFDFDTAHECYNFIFKGLIDQVSLYSQMCIRKCNITALIFFSALKVGTGLNLNGISMLTQYPHSERKIVTG